MRFGSVCSGIEAASVAWHPIGWEAAWLCEIEPFPCAVLAHHYPSVPNYGDMMALPERIRSGEIEAPDLFCGGTPCQAFSVAGNRRSLDDARGNLSLTFCEIADAIDHARTARGEEPAIISWENVPGVLNTKDNAFGCFLAGLAGETVPLQPPGGKWTDAGCVYGPARAIAWRVLDAQYFGLAQRRKRVFVVSSAREGFNPTEVLFEFDGLRRDSAPSREARQGTAVDAETGIVTGGGIPEIAGTILARDFKGVNTFDMEEGKYSIRAEISPTATSQFGEVAGTLTARHDSSPCADRGMNVVTYGIPGNWIGRAPENGGNATTPMDDVAPCLTSADRHGVATIAPPHAFKIRGGCEGGGKGYLDQDEQAFTVACGQDQMLAVPVAYSFDSLASNSMKSSNPHSGCRETELCKTLDTTTPEPSKNQGGIAILQPAYPINTLTLGGRPDPVNDARMTLGVGNDGDPQFTLQAAHSHAVAAYVGGIDYENNAHTMEEPTGPLMKGSPTGGGWPLPAIVSNMIVRRLTPVECERLQGFPDGYTNIPWRGKPEAPDGPRYKALGNSWAVPVVRWVGRRIEAAL